MGYRVLRSEIYPVTENFTINAGDMVIISSNKASTTTTSFDKEIIGVAYNTVVQDYLSTGVDQKYVTVATEGIFEFTALVEESASNYSTAISVGTNVAPFYRDSKWYVVNNDSTCVGKALESLSATVASDGASLANFDVRLDFTDYEDAFKPGSIDSYEIDSSDNFAVGGIGIGVAGVASMAKWGAVSPTYCIDLNSASPSSGDIRLSNAGTIDNTSDGVIEVTEPSIKFVATTSLIHQYDSTAYWTSTVSSAGVVKIATTGSADTYEIESPTITLDGAIIVTGTLNISSDITLLTNKKLYLRDTNNYLYSSAASQADLIAATKIQITAPTIDLEGDTGVVLDGDVSIDGTHTFATGTGAVTINGDATWAGTKRAYFGGGTSGSIYMSTSSQLDIDADSEVEITSPIVDINASTGLALDGANLNSNWTVNGTYKIYFTDTATSIFASTSSQLDIDASSEIELTSPIVDIDASTGIALDGANLNSNWTVNTTNKIYFADTGAYIYSSTASQADLIASTKIQITAPTIDLEGDTAIALDGDVAIDGSHTFATGTGAVTIAGDATWSGTKRAYFGGGTTGSLYMSTSSQLDLDADAEVEITSPIVDINASTGIALDGANLNSNWTVNGTNRIYFTDTAASIYASTSSQLDLAGTSEIALTSPIVDIDASTGLALDGANLNSDWTVNGTYKIYFADTGAYIYSSTASQADLIASTKIQITAPTIDLEGDTAIALDGDVAIDGAHTFATGTGAVTIAGDATWSGTKRAYFGGGTTTWLYASTASQADLGANTLVKVTAPTVELEASTNILLDGNASIASGKSLMFPAGSAVNAAFEVAPDNMTHFIDFNSLAGCLATTNTSVTETALSIKIDVNGTPYYLAAWDNATFG